MLVPKNLVNQVYRVGSMKVGEEGLSMEFKNPFMSATIRKFKEIKIDGTDFPLEKFKVVVEGKTFSGEDENIPFPVGKIMKMILEGYRKPGNHVIEMVITTREVGDLRFKIEDNASEEQGV